MDGYRPSYCGSFATFERERSVLRDEICDKVSRVMGQPFATNGESTKVNTSYCTAIGLLTTHFVRSIWAIGIGIASKTVGNTMAGTASELAGAAGTIGLVTEIPTIILSVARSVLENASVKKEKTG